MRLETTQPWSTAVALAVSRKTGTPVSGRKSIFASAVSGYISDHKGQPGLQAAAAVHGYTTAFYVAAGLFALGFLVALVVLPRRIGPARAPAPVTKPAHEAA